jgi:DNA-binding response OmpR family regulator
MADELKIVLVEDDPDISRSISYNLEREGRYRVHVCPNGEKALEEIRRKGADLIILDLGLPGMDGLEVCRELRHEKGTADLPVLILTARTSEADKVIGFELGADDYVTKPFSVRELSARVHALIRRARRTDPQEEAYEEGDLRIEFPKMRVLVSGEPVSLTRREWRLLVSLVKNRGRVLSREEILRQAWGDDLFVVDRTVDVHVRRVRRKLGEAAEPLETVIGVGYRWRE